jgi:hypothetical protein
VFICVDLRLKNAFGTLPATVQLARAAPNHARKVALYLLRIAQGGAYLTFW